MNDKELIARLIELAEWADANEWEVPIDLGDTIMEAVERLKQRRWNRPESPPKRGAGGGTHMKIDEACINHNAVRIIDDIVSNVWEMSREDESEDHWRLMALGEICGIIDLAKSLKEVLEA